MGTWGGARDDAESHKNQKITTSYITINLIIYDENLKNEGIAPSGTLDHCVHVPRCSLARVVGGRHLSDDNNDDDGDGDGDGDDDDDDDDNDHNKERMFNT